MYLLPGILFSDENRTPVRKQTGQNMQEEQNTMKTINLKTIKMLIRSITGRKEKTQEQLRQEYEENRYDHYQAFGNAFVHFCSGK